MYIYNITTNIDETVQEKWLAWMQETHIPKMLATGKFTAAKMCKVLIEEEMGGHTYSVQYTSPNKETLERYYKEDEANFQQETMKLFAGLLVDFKTELQVVGEY